MKKRVSKKVIPKRGMPLLPRSLPQFRLEVTALLMVGHGWSEKRARAGVKRWTKYVSKRWKQGKPPCAVADHISRWDREKAVCPCKGKGRDCARCRRRGKGGGSRRRSSSRSSRRDPENPKEGEIYESKRGNRWRVSNVDGEKVYVESAGRKTPGRLLWSRSNLRGMREVDGGGPRQLSLFGGDPGPRRGRGKGTVVQTILFPKHRFTVAKAKIWAKKHGYRYGKVDITKNYYRLRQLDPKKVKVRSTITISKGILAIVGTRKV